MIFPIFPGFADTLYLSKKITTKKLQDSYLQRKDDAFKEMNEQAAVVAKITMELQTSREDLFMLKTKLCRNCKEAILGSEQPDINPPGSIPSVTK